MSYDNNWSGGRTSDRGLTEIAILIVLLVFVLFGLLFYFFYQQVNELGEKTTVLTERIAALESRLERSLPQGPAYTENWAPPDAQETPDAEAGVSQVPEQEPFQELSAVKPKAVDTLVVRPDGTMIDRPKPRGEEVAGKPSDTQAARVKSVKVKKGSPGDTMKPERDGGVARTGNTDVDVKQCSWEEQVVYCDLIVSTLSDDNRKILISNRDSFATDYKHATYRISSFQIGVLGDRQRFRSTAFFSRNMPLPVNFQFYGVPSDTAVFKRIQFNIDSTTFAFEDIKISGTGSNGRRSAKTSDGSKEIDAKAVHHKKTVGDVSVKLRYCFARKKKIFCDLTLTNLGFSTKEVVISKDKSFARSRQNIVRRFTSFSLLSTDERHHYHTRAYLKKGRPQVVRYHLFDPLPGITGYKSMQFNINGRTVLFENIAVGS
ncbi:hypothetical protein [Roseibium sp. Sym1]|uniref:hypothetical protein n=1 Tax=Roseibium sp. Sym1 TaxID=3016006 RepID=UPI0022B4A291|nr:hypothetical protein [Roseibium sp. Sym1]